ncbi:MAG: ABC transporter substrate-binding protein [Acidobacteriaceae bacterium]
MAYGPSRIASLQPSLTVTLNAIGELGRVVACTKYCAEVVAGVEDGERLIIHDNWSAKVEQILAARPDLVVASVPYRMESLAEIMKAGVAVLAFAPNCLEDIYRDTQFLANIVGAEQRGAELIDYMQAEIAAVRRRARASQPRVRVYCEEWGKPLIHSQRWVAELVAAAGGEFVGAPGAQTTAEEVAAGDPDVVIAAWCGAGDRVPLERMVEQRGWRELRAVRERRVYCVNDEYLNTPAVTLLDGLRAIASALDPAQFGETARGLRRIAD